MTNNEIRECIKEIIRIKALKCREQELRDRIFKELRKRRKDKLGLGDEDFVKITSVETNEYDPFLMFCKIFTVDPADGSALIPIDEVAELCRVLSIAKGAVRERYGKNFFDRLTPESSRYHDQLSYSVSLDEKNRVRGIDL
jgi:hypothetical protein